jgi:hypothetical protein
MKFSKETIARWTEMATEYLGKYGYELADVKMGVEAWDIAHHVGITREAYEDRAVVDAHIVTALKVIFPEAVFKDRYAY